MKKRRNPVWRLALTAVVILAVAVLLAVTVVKLLQFRGTDRTQGAQTAQNAGLTEQTRQALEENGALLYKGVRYVHRAGLETYLILGVDRTESQIASGVGNGQSDVLLLLVIEPRESRYRVLQINRDLVSQIAVLSPSGYVSSTMFKPICLAHAYASTPEQGCENTVNAVRYLLQDEPIDGYICMNLESIGALNDAVGGVTVTIRGDLTGADPSFTDGATVTLNAETAERFVRARMNVGESDNRNRLERQKEYMRAWLDTSRTMTRQDSQFAMRLLQRLEPLLTTNLTEKRLSSIASDAGKYENGGFLTIDGEYRVVDSFHYCYAYEESLMETVIELFYQAEK